MGFHSLGQEGLLSIHGPQQSPEVSSYRSFNIVVTVVVLFLVPPGRQKVRSKVTYEGGVQALCYLSSYLTYMCMSSTPPRKWGHERPMFTEVPWHEYGIMILCAFPLIASWAPQESPLRCALKCYWVNKYESRQPVYLYSSSMVHSSLIGDWGSSSGE